MVGATRHASITDADLEDLRSLMQNMPAHPEVPDALRRLKQKGFRLVTLTNSPPQPEGGPLERAGIASCLERQFSIDTVRRYKPAPETCRMVAQELGVAMTALCLVAAHTWDILGAQKAGCATALVTRPGNAALPLVTLPQPGIIGADLAEVAEQIIQRWPE
jgi:2-haloacid dehalogenase